MNYPEHPEGSENLDQPSLTKDQELRASQLTWVSDIYADEDVAWVLYQGTFEVQLRYVDAKLSKDINKKIESTASRRQRRRSVQNPGSIFTSEATAQAYGELVIVDWRGLYTGTKQAPKEVKFDVDAVVRYLIRNIDFLGWVMDQSADPANFIGKEDSSEQESK